MEVLRRAVQSFQNSEGPFFFFADADSARQQTTPRMVQITDYSEGLDKAIDHQAMPPPNMISDYPSRVNGTVPYVIPSCHYNLRPPLAFLIAHWEDVGRNHTPDLNFWRQGQTLRNGSTKAKCTSNEGPDHREHHRQYCPHQFAKLRCSPDVCHGKTRHSCT